MNEPQQQRRRVSAFGSSRISRDDPRYSDVTELSRRIAEAGWDGLTGGHQGMMAAFSEGVQDGGGHIRGITLERFPTPPENTLSEEVRAHTFIARMGTLIEEAQAWLVFQGGMGTRAELAMTWDLLATRVLEPRPLILYGEMWEPVVEVLTAQLEMSTDHAFEAIIFCRNHDEVLEALS